MNRHHSPWMRWLFGIATTTGLVAYALGAALLAQSAPQTVTIEFIHKSVRLLYGDPYHVGETLDDLALRMKRQPDIRLQIIGYASPDELYSSGKEVPTAQECAETRAYRVRDYLVLHHGIDSSRITCRGEICSPGSNDRPDKCRRAVITLRRE
jgi:OmpA family